MKRFFQKLAIWIGVLFLALILFSFLLPRNISVSRSITIEAPIDRVFEQVNDLRNWEKWSPWKRMDPMMEMTFSNPPVGQGAFYKWSSTNKQMGSGTMTLAKVVNNEEIVTSMHNDDWGDANSTFLFGHKNNKVEVTWKMENDIGVMPWNKYFGAVMRSELKKQFDKGLEGIKFYAEKS
jgi:uncharacterized protein YndB with AHSA1/START domain